MHFQSIIPLSGLLTRQQKAAGSLHTLRSPICPEGTLSLSKPRFRSLRRTIQLSWSLRTTQQLPSFRGMLDACWQWGHLRNPPPMHRLEVPSTWTWNNRQDSLHRKLQLNARKTFCAGRWGKRLSNTGTITHSGDESPSLEIPGNI